MTGRPLPLEERTMTSLYEDGRQLLEAIPGQEVCDICLASPRWHYPCAPVETESQLSTDGWLLCDACHGCVQAGDAEALMGQAMLGAQERAGITTREFLVSADEVAEMHRQFLAGRGEPSPFPST